MTGRPPGYPVLWLGQCIAVAGLTVVVPLLPFHLADLGVPAAELPWWSGAALAAPALVQVVAAPLWGALGDRVGRKAMVVRAHLGLALAVGLMALADTPAAFLGCRLLQGAFGGVVAATAAFAAGDTPARRRGRALGGLFGAVAAGSLIGPLGGGLLAAGTGQRVLFAVVGALLAVAAVAAAVLLREPVRPAAAAPPLRRVAGTLLRSPRGRSLLLAGVAGQSAAYALLVLFAPRVAALTGSAGAATAWVGVLQAATWAASLAAGPWWGRLGDRGRPERGLAVAAAGCGLAVAVQGVPQTAAGLLPARLGQGVCFAAVVPSVQHAVTGMVGDRARGSGLGLAQGLLDVGQVLGPLLGAAAAALLAPAAGFVAVGLLFALAAALALRADRAPAGPAADPVPPAIDPPRQVIP